MKVVQSAHKIPLYQKNFKPPVSSQALWTTYMYKSARIWNCRFLGSYWLLRFILSYVQSLSTMEKDVGFCLNFWFYIYVSQPQLLSCEFEDPKTRKFWAKIKICVLYWTRFLFELVVRQQVSVSIVNSISAKEAVMLTFVSSDFCYFVDCTLLLWLFSDWRRSALSLSHQSFYTNVSLMLHSLHFL